MDAEEVTVADLVELQRLIDGAIALLIRAKWTTDELGRFGPEAQQIRDLNKVWMNVGAMKFQMEKEIRYAV